MLRKIHPKNALIKFLILAILIPLVQTAPAQTVPAHDGGIHIPIKTWSQQYVSFYVKNNLNPDATFSIPAVWLFSPNGSLVKIINIDSDPQLDKLKKEFPLNSGLPPLENQPTREQVTQLLQLATGKKIAIPHMNENQWAALLILSSSPDCLHCAGYEKALHELQDTAKADLATTQITLDY